MVKNRKEQENNCSGAFSVPLLAKVGIVMVMMMMMMTKMMTMVMMKMMVKMKVMTQRLQQDDDEEESEMPVEEAESKNHCPPASTALDKVLS